MAGTSLDIRQSVLRTALNMAGTAANAGVDTILTAHDAELGKLFQDRNVTLVDGGTVTFSGTSLAFSQNMNLVINQALGATAAAVTVNLGSSAQTLTTNGDMWYAILNRTAGTATTAVVAAATGLPAASNANQEIWLLAKRFDSADGTQMVYFRNGSSLIAGQSARLGSSGSGGAGSGVGDDLDSLAFRASFTENFPEATTSANSGVDVTTGKTNATYSLVKQMFVILYDAGRAIAASTTTTNINLDAVVSGFTAAVGDMVIYNGFARKITAVASQQSFTTEAFPVAPTLAGQVTVSQAVHTKDIYNAAIDGVSLATAFPGTTFSEIMVDYKDNATVGSNLFTPDVAPVLGFSASPDGTTFTAQNVRVTLETDIIQSVFLPSAGSGLFLRWFSTKTSGAGTVNLISYRAFMQKVQQTSSGVVANQAYGMTNVAGLQDQVTFSVLAGKTVATFSWSYPLGVNPSRSFGALDVSLNGQDIPRLGGPGVSSADGYYTEISANAIQFDRDYSSQNINMQVVQPVFVVDSNTQNTTAITSLLGHQFKNYLANGNFDLWQRGTSVTVANTISTYLADRWYAKNSLGTNGVLTYSQVAGVNTGAAFGAKVQITTAPTAAQANGCEFYQVIENGNTLDLLSQVVSAQAKIKAFGNVTQVGIQLCYALTEVKPTLFLGTEQLVTVNSSTFTAGSLFAQVIGTLPTNAGVVGMRIRITAVSSGNTYDLNNGFVVEQAILNIGANVAPFARAGRNIQEEIAICQRYYEKSYSLPTALATATTSGRFLGSYAGGGTVGANNRFKVEKRVSPTVTLWDVSGGVGNVTTTTSGGVGTVRAAAASGVTTSSFEVGATTTDPLIAGHYSADSEI